VPPGVGSRESAWSPSAGCRLRRGSPLAGWCEGNDKPQLNAPARSEPRRWPVWDEIAEPLRLHRRIEGDQEPFHR
jgi:hypothetical protein